MSAIIPMIREYKEKQELEELVVLIREIWREYYTPLIGAEQVEYMLDQFQSVDAISRQIAEENYRYYCVSAALLPGVPVRPNNNGDPSCGSQCSLPAGYYAARPCDDNRVFLSKLYVAEKFRGRGLGKRMLQHLIDAAQNDGAKSIWLTVNKHNPTIDIYRKLGFVITQEIVTDIGNGFVMDDYVMEMSVV